jgi:uncharacterized membrane protein HdeD (DUF308 family)
VDLDNQIKAVQDSVRGNWCLFLAQGIILTILGVLAIIWPQISTIAVDAYVGWLFLFGGALGLVASFYAPSSSDFIWALLSAALSLFVGVILLWNPAQGAVSLTLVLTALFIVEGLFQTAMALRYRATLPGTWGWLLVSGLADLLLAFLVIKGWPGTAAWTLGILAGVNLITTGVAIIAVAIEARRAVDALRTAATISESRLPVNGPATV